MDRYNGYNHSPLVRIPSRGLLQFDARFGIVQCRGNNGLQQFSVRSGLQQFSVCVLTLMAQLRHCNYAFQPVQ